MGLIEDEKKKMLYKEERDNREEEGREITIKPAIQVANKKLIGQVVMVALVEMWEE